jgi:hypothetical protein
VARAHDRLLHQPQFQFDFSRATPLEVPDWLRQFFRFLAQTFGRLQPVFQFLFWAGVVLVVGVILFFVVREIVRYRRQRETPSAHEAPPPEWQPAASRARALLADADRLAAQGNFAEAIHPLLFRTIDDIEEQHPRSFTPAFTSREIADLQTLPAKARTAFAQIAAVVERSFFGDRQVDAEDFRECRRAYESLAFQDSLGKQLRPA